MPAGPCLAQQRLVLDAKSHLTTSELLESMCKPKGTREELETLQVDWELDDWQRDRYEENMLASLHQFFAKDVPAGCTMAIALISEARLLS